MIRLINTIFIIVFLGFNSFAQFQFRLPSEKLHYRIDLESQILFKENQYGIWEYKGALSFKGIDVDDIPANIQINIFKSKDSYILTIPGTGQVYLFDLNRMIFKRLDNTFYRGYNFLAIQYIKNDTIFSHGGSGFWHSNNVSTYFSYKTKEWEMISTPDETGPRWMKSDYGGYDNSRDAICVIEFPELYETKNKFDNYRYFEKDLRNDHWTLYGNVQVGLIKDLGIKRLESKFLDGKFFFFDGSISVWADPVNNCIYKLNRVVPMFNINFEFEYHNGYIYSYNRMNTPTSNQGAIKIDSISIEKLKSISTYKGPFYIKPYSVDLLIFWGVALLFLIASAYYAYRRRNPHNARVSLSEALDGLPDGASDFLIDCLAYPKGYNFSSQLFTEMMGYGSYAYETQRQVRSKLIKGINSYFWAHYRLKDVIIRQTASDDKRFSVYLISEEHYEFLKKLLTK